MRGRGQPRVPGSLVGGCAVFRTQPSFLQNGQLDAVSLVLQELGVGVCGDRHALGWMGSRDIVRTEGPEEAILPGGPMAGRKLPLDGNTCLHLVFLAAFFPVLLPAPWSSCPCPCTLAGAG